MAACCVSSAASPCLTPGDLLSPQEKQETVTQREGKLALGGLPSSRPRVFVFVRSECERVTSRRLIANCRIPQNLGSLQRVAISLLACGQEVSVPINRPTYRGKCQTTEALEVAGRQIKPLREKIPRLTSGKSLNTTGNRFFANFNSGLVAL